MRCELYALNPGPTARGSPHQILTAAARAGVPSTLVNLFSQWELPVPPRRTTTFNRRCRMEARITAQSQSFKLRERLEEAKVSHGQEVRADLPHVRVGVLAATEEAQLMFCNMGSIRVRELLQPGDQGPLATDVTLQGLAVPVPGTRSEERRVGKECRSRWSPYH